MKKFLAGLMTAIMIFTMSSGITVFAADTSAQSNQNEVTVAGQSSFCDEFIAKANSIDKSCEVNTDLNGFIHSINLRIVDAMVKVTNQSILAMVRVAQNMEDPDIDMLVSVTNKMAQSTIKIAAEMGVTVICEYQAFEIDGQTVYIDPLRVISV